MRGRRLQDYPELEKFMRSYWHQGASDFVGQVMQFRQDALSTTAAAPMFNRFVEQMNTAVEAGAIAKRVPQTMQVEFWGRHQRRISLDDYEAAMKALTELPE